MEKKLFILKRIDLDYKFDLFSKEQTGLFGPYKEEEIEEKLNILIEESKQYFKDTGTEDEEDIYVERDDKGKSDFYGVTVHNNGDYHYYIVLEPERELIKN